MIWTGPLPSMATQSAARRVSRRESRSSLHGVASKCNVHICTCTCEREFPCTPSPPTQRMQRALLRPVRAKPQFAPSSDATHSFQDYNCAASIVRAINVFEKQLVSESFTGIVPRSSLIAWSAINEIRNQYF